MDIYVGNLPYETDEQTLQQVFAKYGQVQKVKIVMDHYTDKPRGFAFVTMENNEGANKAISELNGTKLGDREIKVKEARPREDRRNRNFS